MASCTRLAAATFTSSRDTCALTVASLMNMAAPISAFYESEAVVGAAVVDRTTWASQASQPRFEVAVVGLAPGVEENDGRAAVEAAIAGPGAPTVRDRDGLVAAEVSQVRGVINVVYALLVVAVVIAFTGIANTLSLSLHDCWWAW
jgi:putative ABC transport system permease protein